MNMSKKLAPLSQLGGQRVKAVFSDLDGTLTIGQGLPSAVLVCLEQLQSHRYPVVLVSGRPAGWADCLTRLLPIDAMIFENGAGVCLREGRNVRRVDLADASGHHRLQGIFDDINATHGPLTPATDQPFRLFDFAVDLSEQANISDDKVNQLMTDLQRLPGVSAKLSSIHINYWIGSHNKRTAVEYLLSSMDRLQGVSKETVLFCGDSPNDEPLFDFFPLSVGMQNLKPFLTKMKGHPAFLAQQSEGRGFIEVVGQIVGPLPPR